MTARSIAFSNSRTLPGHAHDCKAWMDRRSIRLIFFPNLSPCFDAKCATSAGISPVRSRNAGMCTGNTFRRYRLNVFPVHMPALRERTGDIPALVAHFASKHGERFGKKISRIDRRSIHALQSCAWPGNVRELENAIERAVILSERGTLTVDRDSLASAPAQANIGDRLRSQERET